MNRNHRERCSHGILRLLRSKHDFRAVKRVCKDPAILRGLLRLSFSFDQASNSFAFKSRAVRPLRGGFRSQYTDDETCANHAKFTKVQLQVLSRHQDHGQLRGQSCLHHHSPAPLLPVLHRHQSSSIACAIVSLQTFQCPRHSLR